MWLMVMFDFPVVTSNERKAASRFRNALLRLGFEMTQFSVYMRFCGSLGQAVALCGRLKKQLPANGNVQILKLTNKQYERALVYHGRQLQGRKKSPDHFALF